MYILVDKVIEVYTDDFRNLLANSKDREKDIKLFIADAEMRNETRRIYISNSRYHDLEKALIDFGAELEDFIFTKNVFEDRHKFFTFRHLLLLKVVFVGNALIEYEVIKEIDELTGRRK